MIPNTEANSFNIGTQWVFFSLGRRLLRSHLHYSIDHRRLLFFHHRASKQLKSTWPSYSLSAPGTLVQHSGLVFPSLHSHDGSSSSVMDHRASTGLSSAPELMYKQTWDGSRLFWFTTKRQVFDPAHLWTLTCHDLGSSWIVLLTLPPLPYFVLSQLLMHFDLDTVNLSMHVCGKGVSVSFWSNMFY